MEKLIHIDRKTSNNRSREIRTWVLSILTGVSSVLCFTSIFSIEFSFMQSFKGGLGGGLARLWNEIGYSLLISDGIVLKELGGASEHCGLILMIGMAIAAVITALILKNRNPHLLILLPCMVCLPLIFTKQEPSLFAAGFFLICLILDLIELKSDEGISFWSTGYIAVIMAIVAILAVVPFTSNIFDRPSNVTDLDNGIERSTDEMYYGKAPLGNGDLTNDKRTVDSKETALEVRMQSPDSVYLRGFVGEVFNNDKWDALPYGTYGDSKNLIYWLHKDGFNGAGQIAQVNGILNKAEQNTYEISVKNASKEYAYIPYEFTKFETPGQLNWYDNYFTAGNTGRMKEYSYSADKNSVKRWTEIAGKLFTSKDNEKIAEYLKQESYYNQFIYENYTYLSDDDLIILNDYFGDRGNQSEGHIEYKAAINKIEKYLTDKPVYTEQPMLSQSDKANMLEAFFQENKGYDVHYATAATLMFRYYGIPARYVEGYLITPDDIKSKNPQDVITVPQSNAHAWTEIYVDGVGFVPIEVSPEYEGVMEEADLSIGIENESINRKFENSSNIAKQNKQREGESKEDVNENLIKAIGIMIFLILLLIIIYLIYRLIKALRKVGKRRALFMKSEPKIGVSAIYGYMEELNLDIDESTRALGNKAAYSPAIIPESDRTLMLERLKKLKKEKKANERNKKKIKKRNMRNHDNADGNVTGRLRGKLGRKSR